MSRLFWGLAACNKSFVLHLNCSKMHKISAFQAPRLVETNLHIIKARSRSEWPAIVNFFIFSAMQTGYSVDNTEAFNSYSSSTLIFNPLQSESQPSWPRIGHLSLHSPSLDSVLQSWTSWYPTSHISHLWARPSSSSFKSILALSVASYLHAHIHYWPRSQKVFFIWSWELAFYQPQLISIQAYG